MIKTYCTLNSSNCRSLPMVSGKWKMWLFVRFKICNFFMLPSASTWSIYQYTTSNSERTDCTHHLAFRWCIESSHKSDHEWWCHRFGNVGGIQTAPWQSDQTPTDLRQNVPHHLASCIFYWGGRPGDKAKSCTIHINTQPCPNSYQVLNSKHYSSHPTQVTSSIDIHYPEEHKRGMVN